MRRIECVAFVALLLTGAIPARAARVEYRLQGISDKEIAKNVELSLSVAAAKDRKDLTPFEIDRMFRRGKVEIEEAVAPFGYYHPEVDDTLLTLGNDRYRAVYRVALGEPVRVRDVGVTVRGEGRDQPPFPGLVDDYPLKAGDVLDQRLYERRKNTFAAAAADSGYLDAKFTVSTIRIDRNLNLADIELALDTGIRYQFGPVDFDSSGVDERVLRSFIPFQRGDPFRYDQLLAFQSALGGASYFGNVEAVPRRDMATGREVPIQVHLEPRKPRHYEIGVGYGTDTGARLLLATEFRRLNRAGHRFSGRANISEVELSLHAEYFMPSVYPRTHAYTIGATIAKLDPVAYTTNRIALGPTRSQKRFGWLESITLAYEREDYTVASDAGVTDLVTAGLNYQWKRADDDIYAKKGLRIDLGVRGSHQALLSTQSFFSPTLFFKGVRSLGRGFRFIGRMDTGWVDTSMFHDLPPTIRFFAGGDNSIRGYEYQSLGPRDGDGRVEGGKLLMVTSVELEIPLPGKFALAGFYDSGNAFDEIGSGVYEQGVGGGFRWRSPVGPLRLDLGFPVHHDGWLLHFTMGPDL